ncbi:MAG: SPOR domain-containing protein [Bryobacteraceae bacterium]|jgi:cell division septation protein DedD
MKNKETGEFELLVGNGQIISGFFILALLLAVFFAMGYIVARAKYQQEPGTATTLAANPPSDSRGPAAAPATPPATPPATQTGDVQPQAPTQPAQDAKPEKVEPPPEPVPAETAQGTYWQISATVNQDAARALLQTIKDMGLPVTLSPGPNNFTRVLVGPYSDTATLAHVKTQLENAGLHPVKHTQ